MDKRLNKLWIVIPSLLLSLMLYEFYIHLVKPQVPFMDTMLFIVQIEQVLQGKTSWLNIYGSGEHRGVLYPLITAIEWKLWRLDARITTVLTGFVVAAIFCYWLNAFIAAQKDFVGSNKKIVGMMFILCTIAATIVVSPAGFELWTLDLGFAQLVKNFLIVTFLYWLAVKQFWNKTFLHAFLYGTLGGALILLATYGWSYPLLFACLFVLFSSASIDRTVSYHALVVALLMILGQVIYVYSGNGVFEGDKTNSALSVTNVVKSILFGAASIFIANEPMTKISFPIWGAFVLGGAVLLMAAMALLLTLIQPSKEKIFLASLTIFSLAVLAGVAVARGSETFTNSGASRYFVDFVWLFLAPLAIVITTKKGMFDSPVQFFSMMKTSIERLLPFAQFLAFFLFLSAAYGHYRTWQVEIEAAPHRSNVFNAMTDVYIWGVNSEEDAKLLQSPLSVATKAISIAQTYNLAILHTENTQCSLKGARYKGDWYSAEENDARWMGRKGVVRIGGCAQTITIKGYIPESFTARTLGISYGSVNKAVAVESGKEFILQLDRQLQNRVTVGLEVDQITSPFLNGLSDDRRELGILLTYIGE